MLRRPASSPPFSAVLGYHMRRNAYCSLLSLTILLLLTGLVNAGSQPDGSPSAFAHLESPQGELPVQPSGLTRWPGPVFSGGLGVTALKALVPASNLVAVTSSASNWVWETAPGDLRVYNEQTLLRLGASSDDVDRLLRHPFFTTSLRTRLVTPLSG